MKTITNNLLLSLFLLMISCNYAVAQIKGDHRINGLIKTNKGQPVGLATVTLLRAADSAIVKSTLTTVSGTFEFKNLLVGTYMIRASSVGYKTVKSGILNLIADQKNLDLPAIMLDESEITLATVNVTASKPVIEHRTDKTVMNVEKSILATGNNALEILARAPGVTIDKDDNIRLNGKEGINVMINNKMTYLTAAQLATLLRSTDGNSISTIELMTSPSAKFDASGNSGVINIKLKKNAQIGTNGSVAITGGYGKHGKGNATLTLNHKEGNLSLYGTLNHSDSKSEFNLRQLRVVPDSNETKTYFSQHSTAFRTIQNNSYRLGGDLATGDRNTLGLLISGYRNTSGALGNSLTDIGQQAGEVTSYQDQVSEKSIKMKYFNLSFNDILKLDTLGHELSFDYDHSRYSFVSAYLYNTSFYTPDGSAAAPILSLRQQTPSAININVFKLDYVFPLPKVIKFEAGVKYSHVNTDNDLNAQRLAGGEYVNDSTLTNRFNYDERVSAVYLNLSRTFVNMTVQAGLRAEHTASEGTLITTGTEVKTNYTNLFPSLLITHKLNERNELSIAYSKRVDRPVYNDLNPFIFYIDQYSYSVGNPFLKAQFTNKIEFNYTYDHTLNLTAGYNHAYNYISEVALTDPRTKVTVYKDLNFRQQNYYNLSISSPYHAAKWWTGNVNAVAFYSQFKSDSLLGANYDRGLVSLHMQSIQYLNVLNYRAEIMVNYDSPYINGSYRYGHIIYSDIGISHSLAGKKASLKLSVTDVFNTNGTTMIAKYRTNDITLHLKPESRVARVTFTYNFGDRSIKSHHHISGAEEEKSRAG